MARPLAVKRHERILEQVSRTGAVSVAALSDELTVSRETIRRDLKMLADRGQLDIVHGGATRRIAVEPSMAYRMAENTIGKSAIAKAAVRLVDNGMVILLDGGSTALGVADALVAKRDLTVITPSLGAALVLSRVPTMRVVMLGGEVDPTEEATIGIDTMAMLNHYRVDIAFLAAGGLSYDGQPTDFSRLAAEQRRRMAGIAEKTYFLVDRSKFGRETPIRIDALDSVTGIIVDEDPAPYLADALSRRRLEVLRA